MDLNRNKPLSALYVKVGDKLVKCYYNIERTNSSESLQDPELKNTEFEVMLPVSYLDGVDKLRFVLVGNDSPYGFEDVVYKLTN